MNRFASDSVGMSMRGRYLFFTLVVLAGISLGIAPALIHFFAERELSRMQKQGIKLQATGTSGFLVGLAAESIESWVALAVPTLNRGSLPMQLRAEDVSVSVRPHVFPPGFSIYTRASVYGGTLAGVVSKPLHNAAFSGELRGVDLSLHPQLRGLGIEAGNLDITMENFFLVGAALGTSSAQFQVRGLEIVPPEALQKVTRLSTLTNGDIAARVVLKDLRTLTIDACSFDSSLASGHLSGSAVILPSGKIDGVRASLTVKLNRQDSSRLGPWLPLLTSQMVPSTALEFTCNVLTTDCGDNRSSKTAIGCLKATCM